MADQSDTVPPRVSRLSVTRQYFKHKTVFYLSIVEIFLGVASIAFGLTAIFVGCYASFVGTAIWSGTIFVSCGILGILAAVIKNNGTLISAMVMAIISTSVAVAPIIHASYSMANEQEDTCYDYECNCYDWCHTTISVRQGINLSILLVAVIALPISLTIAILCGKPLCYVTKVSKSQKSD
ncbi:uncharacterized protein LOC102809167 isoform X1 [Saccoglossus kowalevskii]